MGTSKGAELGLLLSTYYDTINNVVLFAPLSYVSRVNPLNEVSPWTYNGEEIEYLDGSIRVIPMFRALIDLLLNKPHDQIIFTNSRLENSVNLEEARIKVENSNAKILMFYGEDDRAYDAKSYSNIIKEYAKNEVIIHGYENAGHTFDSIIEKDGYNYRLMGGDLDSNIEANLDSKRIMLETLSLWHK